MDRHPEIETFGAIVDGAIFNDAAKPAHRARSAGRVEIKQLERLVVVQVCTMLPICDPKGGPSGLPPEASTQGFENTR